MDKNIFRAEMVRCGLTQSRLAKEIGMAESTMIRKINNNSFTISEAEAIGKVFGIKRESLGSIFFN